MATQTQERFLTADEFLRIEFGSDLRAELDNGVIRMMAGGSRLHDRIQVNLIIALGNALRGSGCRPSGSDMAIRTHGASIRYPDVSVTRGRDAAADDAAKAIDDPRAVFEILSPSTAAEDRGIKLQEYKALTSVETIALIDPETGYVVLLQRTGRDPDGWSEVSYTRPHDIDLPSLGIVIPHDDIFARD